MKKEDKDNDRKKRYEQKFFYAESSLEKTEKWLEEFKETKKEQSLFAAYKTFQELVESLNDIIAMFLKDKNLIIEDDYTNINTLKNKGLITENEAKTLIEANGLRNRIVHKYNGVEIELFVDSASSLFNLLYKIIKKLKDLILIKR